MDDIDRAEIEKLEAKLDCASSYERLPILLELADFVTSEEWLRRLGHEWTTCDNIGAYLEELRDSPLAWGERPVMAMMTDQEIAALGDLPDIVTIYRGCYQKNKWGLSWSLSRATAEAFPAFIRYWQPGQPLLVTARIKRQEIIALKVDRDEGEIIAWRPRHVSTRHIRNINSAA